MSAADPDRISVRIVLDCLQKLALRLPAYQRVLNVALCIVESGLFIKSSRHHSSLEQQQHASEPLDPSPQHHHHQPQQQQRRFYFEECDALERALDDARALVARTAQQQSEHARLSVRDQICALLEQLSHDEPLEKEALFLTSLQTNMDVLACLACGEVLKFFLQLASAEKKSFFYAMLMRQLTADEPLRLLQELASAHVSAFRRFVLENLDAMDAILMDTSSASASSSSTGPAAAPGRALASQPLLHQLIERHPSEFAAVLWQSSLLTAQVFQTHHVAQRETQPSSRASIERGAETAASTLSRAFPGVYGMESAVETLHVSLLEPLEDCSRFLAFGTVPPKGILLTGAPGSGKSHLARAVADAVRRRGLASFVSVNCTDLLTKFVGDTEKALRELFVTAHNAAPCVLYFDQIESLAPVRGFDTSTEQTFDRMLNMLLVEMDGFRTSLVRMGAPSALDADAHRAFLKQHVVILASTARKELLDPSILRPGRFDVHIHVDFPDESAREQIVLDALATIPLDYTQDPELRDAYAVAAYVAKHTSGKSAGDVRAVLREAAMASMREQMDAPAVAIKFVKQALVGGGDILSQQSGTPQQTPVARSNQRPGGRGARPKTSTLRDRRLRGK